MCAYRTLVSDGGLRLRLQQRAIWNVMHMVATGDVVQEFAKAIPQAVLLELPRMAVEMPDSAVFQDGVEEVLAQSDPICKARQLCEVGSQTLEAARARHVPGVSG